MQNLLSLMIHLLPRGNFLWLLPIYGACFLFLLLPRGQNLLIFLSDRRVPHFNHCVSEYLGQQNFSRDLQLPDFDEHNCDSNCSDNEGFILSPHQDHQLLPQTRYKQIFLQQGTFNSSIDCYPYIAVRNMVINSTGIIAPLWQSSWFAILKHPTSRVLQVWSLLLVSGRLPLTLATYLLKQGHLDLIARAMSRWILNVFKDGDSTTSLADPCQCSLIFIVKKCFLMFS